MRRARIHTLSGALAIGALVASVAVVAAVMLGATKAHPHEAKSGWTYPYACCSNQDCREIPAGWVAERPEGYVIATTGEVVSYGDRRVKHSPDGVFHWCSVAGADTSRTICLFVPPRAF